MAQPASALSERPGWVPASGLVSEELRGGNLNGRRVHPGTPGESRGRRTLSGVLPSV